MDERTRAGENERTGGRTDRHLSAGPQRVSVLLLLLLQQLLDSPAADGRELEAAAAAAAAAAISIAKAYSTKSQSHTVRQSVSRSEHLGSINVLVVVAVVVSEPLAVFS